MPGSHIFLAALWHRVWIPSLFDGSLTSCPNPLYFRWLFDIVLESSIILAALRHHVRIFFLVDNSPASSPDPFSFLRLSNTVFWSLSFLWPSYIMFRSFFFSVALWHHVQIPYCFDGSPTLCLDPFSFRKFSSTVSGSLIFSTAFRHRVRIPFSFWQVSGIMLKSPIFSTALWHCAWIPYHFNGSPASCMDPFSFRRLSGIVFGSPIFSVAF